MRYLFWHYRILAFLILTGISPSCEDTSSEPAPGLSDFMILNKLGDTVFISYEVEDGFESFRDEIEMISSGDTILIIHEARLGMFGTPPPKPSDVIKRIDLYSDKSKTQKVYSQNPTVDSLWIQSPSNKYQDFLYLEYILQVSM